MTKTVDRPTRQAPGGATRTLIICLVGIIGLFSSYALRSNSVYTDDSLNHFQIARWSSRHPQLLLDVWGRPGFTILYAPVAQLGLTAASLFSAVIAGLVCGLTAILAESYNLRWGWVAALLTALQTEFARQGYATLTELPTALYLVLALYAHRTERWTLMAISAGLLPLARYETLPLQLIFLVILLRERRYWQIGLLIAPLLLWNIYWGAQTADWTRLLFPLDGFLFNKPGEGAGNPPGPPWHYLVRMPVAFGSIPFALAVYGLIRLRLSLLHLCTIVYIALLGLSYMLLPSQVAGYDRHLAVLAPEIGIFGLAGLEHASEAVTSQRLKWLIRGTMALVMFGLLGMAWALWNLRGRVLLDAFLGIAIVLAMLIRPQLPTSRFVFMSILGALIGVLIRVAPFYMLGNEQIPMALGQWYSTSEYRGRLVVGSSVWFPYGAEIDPFDKAIYRAIQPREVEEAPAGSLIMWEPHNAVRRQWPLNLLDNPARFKRLRTEHGTTLYGSPYELSAYLKLAP